VDGTPDVLLIGTGSEVQCALRAAETLDEEGVQAQVVSMPSWELFADQPEEYQRSVLPPDVTARVSIEAGVPSGWERFVGMEGERIGVDRFGASAPGEVMMEKYGFTAERVVEAATAQVQRHG
jgi:transketolase